MFSGLSVENETAKGANLKIEKVTIKNNKDDKSVSSKEDIKKLIKILKILLVILLIGIIILVVQSLNLKLNKENKNENLNGNNNIVWMPDDNSDDEDSEAEENNNVNPNLSGENLNLPGSSIEKSNENLMINSFSFAGYTLNSNISYELKYQDENLYLITEEGVIINIQYQKEGVYEAIANNLDEYKKVLKQIINRKKYEIGTPKEYIRNGVKYVDVSIYDKEMNLCSRILCSDFGGEAGLFVAIQNSPDYIVYSHLVDMFVNAKKTSNIYTGEDNEFQFPDFSTVVDIMDIYM